MDNKVYALLAILLASVASVALAPVYAQSTSLTVQTDKSSYMTGDTITITGNVGTIKAGQPVLIQVYNEKNNPAGFDQVMPGADGSYNSTFKAGGQYYAGSGTYTVKAAYAGQTKTSTFTFTASGALVWKTFTLNAGGKQYPIQYMITGGSITGMTISDKLSTLSINITTTSDGTLTLKLPRNVIDARQNVTTGADSEFAAFADSVENLTVDEKAGTATVDARTISIDFVNGTESIEVVGTWAIPEFGAIAAIVLAVAIVGIIVATAKYNNKLNFSPRL